MEKLSNNYNLIYYSHILLNTCITKKIDKIRFSLDFYSEKIDIKILIDILKDIGFIGTEKSYPTVTLNGNQNYCKFYKLYFNNYYIPLFYKPKKPYFPAYSITIHDPDHYICYELGSILNSKGFKQNINQIEIAIDIHDNIDFWDTILNKHLWIKWIKTNKINKDDRKLINKFETTLYNGDTRATARSSRVYPKIENGKRFLRFEIVLNNGKYLKRFSTLEAMLNINKLNIKELFQLKELNYAKLNNYLEKRYKQKNVSNVKLAKGVFLHSAFFNINNVQAQANELKKYKRKFNSRNVSSQFFFTIPEDEMLKDRLGAIAITGFPN